MPDYECFTRGGYLVGRVMNAADEAEAIKEGLLADASTDRVAEIPLARAAGKKPDPFLVVMP
jgi:hypothetical protein